MTRAGGVVIVLVALGLGGLGYVGYLKNNPTAEPGPVAEWARSIGKEQVLPVVAVVVAGVLGSVGVGVYRHHQRGNQAWEAFAARLGVPCHNAGFSSDEPSRVQGKVDGRALLLETRAVRLRTSGGWRSSVKTDMKLELRGVAGGLTVTSSTMGLGSGLLGNVARGVTNKLVEGAHAEQHQVETGDARFDGAARAFCPDPEAARAWLQPRSVILLDLLSERGYRLDQGELVHSTNGKADSLDQLNASLARLSSFAETLEAGRRRLPHSLPA